MGGCKGEEMEGAKKERGDEPSRLSKVHPLHAIVDLHYAVVHLHFV